MKMGIYIYIRAGLTVRGLMMVYSRSVGNIKCDMIGSLLVICTRPR